MTPHENLQPLSAREAADGVLETQEGAGRPAVVVPGVHYEKRAGAAGDRDAGAVLADAPGQLIVVDHVANQEQALACLKGMAASLDAQLKARRGGA